MDSNKTTAGLRRILLATIGLFKLISGGDLVKKLIAAASAAGILFCGVMPVLAQSADQRWQATINTETRYFTYSSNNPSPPTSTTAGGKGDQLYVPIAGQLIGRPSDDVKVEFMVRSAYVYARQKTNGVTGIYSGMTDTTLTGTMTYFGFNGVQPFVSLAVNAPTGQSNASGNAQRAKSDSDIVQLPAFGEGWNVGPTAGVNVSINDETMASFGVGYTNRGTFLREGATDATPTHLNPGDVVTGTFSVGYRGERLSLKGQIAYSVESLTTLDGAEFYKAGDRIIGTGAAGYAWTENWSSRVQVTYSHFNRNKVLLPGASAIATEEFNSNSDVIRVVIDTTFAKDGLSVGPVLGYVYRNRNGYDPTTFQFLAAKTSWSAGLAAAYAASNMARLTAKVERLWVHESGSPDKFALDGTLIVPSAVPASITNAWQFSLAGIFRF